MTKEIIKTLQSLDLKEVWTYHISCKTTPATTYRRGFWQNLRDGFRECDTFWHLTESTSDPFDMTDPAAPGRYDDYASLYVDWTLDTALLSRRQPPGAVGTVHYARHAADGALAAHCRAAGRVISSQGCRGCWICRGMRTRPSVC